MASSLRRASTSTTSASASESSKPSVRSYLDIDTRFFPIGLHPGTILEIKGAELAGKTFLLTYFIARIMTVYPEKKVVLIDTRHKFHLHNYISILCHFDPELKALQANLSAPASSLVDSCPRVQSYCDRLLIIKCYSAEDLMLTVGPANESSLEDLLLRDPQVCLVAIDSIDSYSYAESLESIDARLWPNVMQDLKQTLSKSRCPCICTTLLPVDEREYRQKAVPSRSRPSAALNLANSEKVDTEAGCSAQVPSCPKSNVKIDYSVFSNIMELILAPQAEIEKLVHPEMKQISHFATASLKSKTRTGFAGNHHVKFSIFSDMLWVQETQKV